MLTLYSDSFAQGQEIPQRHGKKEGNVSPALAWDDPPVGTESFALVVVDRHRLARNFVHWMVVDISAETSMLAEDSSSGAMPKGAWEPVAWYGPSPPSGTHDYEFTLYALSTPRLDLPREPTLEQFVAAVEPVALARVSLMGTFTRD